MQIVSQKELARALNLSTQTIINYEKQGLINRLSLAGAKYDLEDCLKKVNRDYNHNFEVRKLQRENFELRAKNKQLEEIIKREFNNLKNVIEMIGVWIWKKNTVGISKKCIYH